MNLRTATALLPTPSVADGTGGHKNRSGARSGERLLPGLAEDVHASGGRFGKYEPAVRRWEEVLGDEPPSPTLPDGRDGAHRLNPQFAAWMMGIHKYGLDSLSRKNHLMAVGNAVNPVQAEYAIRGLLARRLTQQED